MSEEAVPTKLRQVAADNVAIYTLIYRAGRKSDLQYYENTLQEPKNRRVRMFFTIEQYDPNVHGKRDAVPCMIFRRNPIITISGKELRRKFETLIRNNDVRNTRMALQKEDMEEYLRRREYTRELEKKLNGAIE